MLTTGRIDEMSKPHPTLCSVEFSGNGAAMADRLTERRVSVLEVVKLLEQVLETTAQVEWLPNRPGDVSRTWADISAARDALGYAPRVSLEEGIPRFARWLREGG